jgi:hypothetical protein
MNTKPEALLWLVDAHGIYIPQIFAGSFAERDVTVTGVSAEDWAALEAGPDHIDYWEAWDNVLIDAKVKIAGKVYSLYQEGDVWLIPDGMVWSDSDDFFLWPTP